jgi:hypothetical protein
MKIEITCGLCHKKFIGGSTHRRYCDTCRKNESAAIVRAVADRKKKEMSRPVRHNDKSGSRALPELRAEGFP